MTVAFTWRRREYTGLAIIGLAVGIWAQLPIAYHLFFIMQIAQEKNLLLFIGACFGASVILAALNAFLSESLPRRTEKEDLTKKIGRRNVLDASLVIIISYTGGYLIPLFLGSVILPDFNEFIQELVFLIGIGSGLLAASIISYIIAAYRSSPPRST
ncbi:MAG: hypothetical protein ACFFBD_23200 [Candidatus Hodarchaeota archaeon]